MTQLWQGERLVPVTVVLAGPCPVVQRKTPELDGYRAVQLGWGELSGANKPLSGHVKKAGAPAQRYLREFRDYAPEEDAVTVAIFSPGQRVDVAGASKGRGTAGVMKRWNFRGMSATHGTKKKHRHPGSIGQRKTPGRVFKGKKMAGHYGHEQVTIKGLELVEVREGEHLLLIKGAIPGPSGGLVVVKDAVKDNAGRV
jgi:large subunit ribosomal protein L3